MTRSVVKVAVAAATAGLVAGCATVPAPPISAKQLAYAHSFDLFTLYWAGKTVHGIPLTEADGLGDYNPQIGVTMYYGNCVHKSIVKLGGCTLPLKITTVWYIPHSNISLGAQRNVRVHGVPAVIFNHGDEVEVYTDAMAVDVVGATPKLTMEGVRQLTTFNRTPTAAWPAFPAPQFTPGVSLKQLAAERKRRGNVKSGPPGDLQPSVNQSQ
ncbi:MAG TPA: hypothetical protein VHM72_05495 [Solirubrobacteraceae bacterium]|nr:hypothetical protein [Solirubrobacteraceae bacterium]